MYIYGIRQKECTKCAVAALISAVYRAPRLSLCVCRTSMLSLKVHSLVKRCDPWIMETRHVLPNCGVLAKSAAIRFPHKSRGNHKSVACFLSKRGVIHFN